MMKLAICAIATLAAAATLSAATPTAPAAKASAPARTAPAAPAERTAPNVFSGDYVDAPAREVLMDIARTARLNAILPSSITAKISAHFERMPIRQALAEVASLADADYRIMDRTLTVTARKVIVNARPAETVVTAPAPDREGADVMREARRIDREERESRRSVAAREPSVRVETYINVQSAPQVSPYGGYAPYSPFAGYASTYYPRITPVPNGNWWGGAGGTVWLPGGASITALPNPVYVLPGRCRW